VIDWYQTLDVTLAQHVRVKALAAAPSRIARAGGGFPTSRPWMGWGSGGAQLTGFSRATHAWDRLPMTAGTPAHAVTAATAPFSVIAVPAVVAATWRARVAQSVATVPT
jgi:hypothetical protein